MDKLEEVLSITTSTTTEDKEEGAEGAVWERTSRRGQWPAEGDAEEVQGQSPKYWQEGYDGREDDEDVRGYQRQREVDGEQISSRSERYGF